MVAPQICPCCGLSEADIHVKSPRDREYLVKRAIEANIFRCRSCHSLFQSPWPTPEETYSFYHSNYQNYEGSKVPLLAKLFSFLQKKTAQAFGRNTERNAAVLDFGCNQGAFLRSLRRAGFSDLSGYDVVPLTQSTTDFAFFSSLKALVESQKTFSVIRMNHVIEHLSELDQTMIILRSLLKPGGRIIGQTPNADHYTSKWMGTYWGPLHYPYHLAIFSRQGLRISAERWGLKLLTTSSSIMPTGWAMTAENWTKAIVGSRTIGRTPYYVLYLFATAPFVIFDRILGLNGHTAIMNFTLARE